MSVFKVGIIGGTGLEDPKILANAQEHVVDTPFGPPSDVLIEGTIKGVPCVLLSRHGRKHQISPSHINYRANIWALKKLGAKVILASSASGSLRENIKPGHIVFLDSFIDRTNKREQSFYDGEDGHPLGICHIPMHPIFDELLRSCKGNLGLITTNMELVSALKGRDIRLVLKVSSTENGGADLVNMTVCPEAILAKELAIPYASIALSTDYDCWKDSHETVSVELVTKIVNENAQKTLKLFVHAAERICGRKDEFNKIIEEAKITARTAVMDGGHQLNFDYL